jgi:hypothetical protein
MELTTLLIGVYPHPSAAYLARSRSYRKIDSFEESLRSYKEDRHDKVRQCHIRRRSG